MKNIKNINSKMGSILVVLVMLFGLTSTASATWGWNWWGYNNHYNYTSYGSLCGRVTIDTNKNKKYDKWYDKGIANVKVKITDKKGKVYYTRTNSSGYYSLKCIRTGWAKVQIIESTLPKNLKHVYGTTPKNVCIYKNCQAWAGANGYKIKKGYTNKINTVCGHVFEDKNKNHRWDKWTDKGLRNIKIEITAANGKKFYTRTDKWGWYEAKRIPVGRASVKIVESTLPSTTFTQVVGSNPTPVNVKSKDEEKDGIWEEHNGYVFGAGTGAVCGLVFEDTNKNKKFDKWSDKLLKGVRVNILDKDGNIIGHDTTDNKGNYYVNKLPAGKVYVDIVESTLPSNLDPVIYVGTDPTEVTIQSNKEKWEQCNGYKIKDDVEVKSITSARVEEGNPLVHTITVTELTQNSVYAFKIINGTAKAGKDFTLPTTLDFSNGVRLVKHVNYDVIEVPANTKSFTVSVPSIDDSVHEETERYTINVDTIINANNGNMKHATGTIEDNDELTFTIGNATATEGENNLSFTITLQNASATATTIAVQTVNGTALDGEDYTAVTTDVTIDAGQTTATVTVPVVDNNIKEPTETMTLNGTLNGTTQTGTGTIIDDEPNLTFTIGDANATEGENNLTFTITLSSASATATTIPVQTANGTALEGEDYTAVTTDVTIDAGQTTATVTVPVVDNDLIEPTETMTLNGTLNGTTQTGTGTILDNDGNLTFTIGDANATEGESNLTFTVSLSKASASATTIAVQTVDGTGANGANVAEDYTAVITDVTIDAGQTTATVTVPVVDNNLVESTETMTLYGTSNDTANADDSGTGTILDNDENVTVVSISNGISIEPQYINHDVILSGATTSSTILTYTIVGVTAEEGNDSAAGADFVGTPLFTNADIIFNQNDSTITVPAGISTFKIYIETLRDNRLSELTETYTITVSGKNATGTIINNPVP